MLATIMDFVVVVGLHSLLTAEKVAHALDTNFFQDGRGKDERKKQRSETIQ